MATACRWRSTPTFFGGTASNNLDDFAAQAKTLLAGTSRRCGLDAIGDAEKANHGEHQNVLGAPFAAGLPEALAKRWKLRCVRQVWRPPFTRLARCTWATRTSWLQVAWSRLVCGPWPSKASKPFGRDMVLHDTSFGWRFINPKLDAVYGTEGMGQTAENLVELHGISREDQDAFAMRSQHKAAAAQREGRLGEEIVPIAIPRRKQEDLIFESDEFIKPQTSLEVWAPALGVPEGRRFCDCRQRERVERRGRGAAHGQRSSLKASNLGAPYCTALRRWWVSRPESWALGLPKPQSVPCPKQA